MTNQSYKILAAQRLAIDPNELLMYFEIQDFVLVTTPDGIQHTFIKSELDRPRAKNISETDLKGSRPPSTEGGSPPSKAKRVAKKL